MKKFYAIAALLLLGATAVQAQEHQTCNVKAIDEIGFEMEAINGGHAVEATPAERAAMKAQLKAVPAAGEAYYYRPAGSFFVGIAGTTTYSYQAPRLVLGPYKTYTFKAQEADSYAWRFQIGGNWYDNLTSKNINAKYNFESDSVPSLTVGETEYHVFGWNGSSVNYYGMLYAVPRPIERIKSTSAGSYYASPKYFGFRDRDNIATSGTTYYTGSTIGYNGGTGYWFGYNTRGWNGMATYVEAPQNPYLIHGGAIRYAKLEFVDANADNNVPIKIDVYSVTTHEMDTLELGEKLASTTVNLTNTTPASGGFLYEFEEPVVVESEIAVVVSGYDNEALKGFTLSVSRDTWDEGHGQHGYMVHLNSSGVPTQFKGLKNFFTNNDLGVTAPTILLDVEFPFMRYYYNSVSDPVMEFNFDGECTSAGVGDYAGNQLAIWASSPSNNWNVSGEVPSSNMQLKAEDGGDVPEWISYNVEDVMNNDAYSYRSIMTITAAENESKRNRSAVLTITQPAAEAITLTINQVGNPTGINGVDAARTVENISYYNLAGVESATPFQGVNIEVKKYNDGSKEVTKVVR